MRAIVGGCRRATACLCVLPFALLLPASASAADCPGADALPGQVPTAALEQATVCLLNAERTANGFAPLPVDPTLTDTAQRYAGQMVTTGHFAHVDASGGGPASRVVADNPSLASLWVAYGENLGWGTLATATPRVMVAAWMNSPEHRANVLDPEWDQIGVGIAPGAPVANGPAGSLTYDALFGNVVAPDPPSHATAHHRRARARHHRPAKRARTRAAGRHP